jgi:hypothetical protein
LPEQEVKASDFSYCMCLSYCHVWSRCNKKF